MIERDAKQETIRSNNPGQTMNNFGNLTTQRKLI